MTTKISLPGSFCNRFARYRNVIFLSIEIDIILKIYFPQKKYQPTLKKLILGMIQSAFQLTWLKNPPTAEYFP